MGLGQDLEIERLKKEAEGLKREADKSRAKVCARDHFPSP